MVALNDEPRRGPVTRDNLTTHGGLTRVIGDSFFTWRKRMRS